MKKQMVIITSLLTEHFKKMAVMLFASGMIFLLVVPTVSAAISWPVLLPKQQVYVNFGYAVNVGDQIQIYCTPNGDGDKYFLININGSAECIAGDPKTFTVPANGAGDIVMLGNWGHVSMYIDDIKVNGVSIGGTATTPTPSPTTSPTPTPTPTTTPVPTPTSTPVTPTPTTKPTPSPLTVNFIGNKTSLIVQIMGGSPPYTVDWLEGQQLVNGSTYTIRDLQPNTTYTVIVTDSEGNSVTSSANTGDLEGFIPPEFPSPGGIFQEMLDNFGLAGTIGIAIIGAAVALGLIIILGIWGWRLAKKWLSAAK